MLVRQPVVAGRFYPGRQDDLQKEVRGWLKAGSGNVSSKFSGREPWAVMLPHAGYMYCGNVIGKTLAGAKLRPRLIVLCPNHTGKGQALGVWPDGAWLTPLGAVKVDDALAAEILESGGGFAPDTLSHLGEHSIEVLLPFLQEGGASPEIVPISVGTQNPLYLARAAQALAAILKEPRNANVGLVVSSDMNHYEDEETTIAKDNLALEQALAASPEGLLQVVGAKSISMCGAGPMALALYVARDLGGVELELAAHETSAKASGDRRHTVGYAGIRMFQGAA